MMVDRSSKAGIQRSEVGWRDEKLVSAIVRHWTGGTRCWVNQMLTDADWVNQMLWLLGMSFEGCLVFARKVMVLPGRLCFLPGRLWYAFARKVMFFDCQEADFWLPGSWFLTSVDGDGNSFWNCCQAYGVNCCSRWEWKFIRILALKYLLNGFLSWISDLVLLYPEETAFIQIINGIMTYFGWVESKTKENVERIEIQGIYWSMFWNVVLHLDETVKFCHRL